MCPKFSHALKADLNNKGTSAASQPGKMILASKFFIWLYRIMTQYTPITVVENFMEVRESNVTHHSCSCFFILRNYYNVRVREKLMLPLVLLPLFNARDRAVESMWNTSGLYHLTTYRLSFYEKHLSSSKVFFFFSTYKQQIKYNLKN